MKKLSSDGFGLIKTENNLYFSILNDNENKKYFQFNGNDIHEISIDLYLEKMIGINAKKIINQLSNPDIDYIESIAKCNVQENGITKLVSLTEYYNDTFGPNWKIDYNFDLIPSDIVSQITNLKVCSIQDEVICLIWPHNIILRFNKNGKLIQYNMFGVTEYCDTLYDICSDGQSAWAVCPSMGSVIKYKFPSLDVERVYNYTNTSTLEGINYPQSISFIDEQLFICDMENNRIVLFNPENGDIETHIPLDCKPFEFIKWKNQFVIGTNDGIYIL